MRILFIAKGQETLAIEYLSAVLKQAGHEVVLLFEPELDGGMGFFPPYLMKWLNSDAYWIEQIQRKSPDLIALSCPLNMYPFVRRIAALIKRHFSIPVVVGGGHPTLAPDYIMQNRDIDMICIGEGEEPIVELADRMQKGSDYTDTRNFWFRKNNLVIQNDVRPLLEDISSLPFPDRDIFYQYGCFSGNLYFVAGRGCPYKCSYCCQHAFRKVYKGKGRYVRLRTVENVIRELQEAVSQYDVKHIHSEDDTFTGDHKWLFDFCDEYHDKIGLPFYCHVRPGTLTEEVMNRLAQAGCDAVFFGIDSGNEPYRRSVLNRDISNDVIYQQAHIIKKSGIKLSTASMFGMPGETDEQMMDTFQMAVDVESDFAYDSIYYPFYGTDLYHYAVNNNYLSDDNVKLVVNGLGSPYQYSMIKSKHSDLAMVLKNCLPSYIGLPFVRFLSNFIIKSRWVWASSVINLLFTPFSYAYMGRMKRREILRTILHYLKQRFLKSKNKPLDSEATLKK